MAMATVSLRELVPSAHNNVNTQFIVLEKGIVLQEGKEAPTCMSLVADETASVEFHMWGAECHAFENGDIIRLTNGIFSICNERLLLRAGRKGKALKVGEFFMAFVESPNMSDIHASARELRNHCPKD